jgi:N-acetylmuramoyl-L-alanine amidase
MKKLAIFPGHVGKDAGAIDLAGPGGDQLMSIEAVITAGIASKMSLMCKLLGIANRVAVGSFDSRIAQTTDCEVGISIHADSVNSPLVHGFHVIYFPGSKVGKELAWYLDAALATSHDKARSPHSRRDLAILRNTPFPCVLVECGFLTNVNEEAALMNDEYQLNLAFEIVQGFRRWMYR